MGTFPNLRQLNTGLKSAGYILSVIDKTKKIILDDPNGENIEGIDSDINLIGVSYQYVSKDTLVLNSISLSFQHGKTTALVGESG